MADQNLPKPGGDTLGATTSSLALSPEDVSNLGLQAGKEYTFTVKARVDNVSSGAGVSAPISAVVSAEPAAVPGAPGEAPENEAPEGDETGEGALPPTLPEPPSGPADDAEVEKVFGFNPGKMRRNGAPPPVTGLDEE